jgi:hypothetical protein
MPSIARKVRHATIAVAGSEINRPSTVVVASNKTNRLSCSVREDRGMPLGGRS